jgi:putative ABC transport system substrate-binding protein
MRRRTFVAGLAGAAVWPRVAFVQQQAMPVVGFLASQPAGPASAGRVAAFVQGLSEQDFVEGRNVAIEYRWAEGHYDRLPALVDDLVRRRVAVIAATTQDAALAAKAGTTTIPVVFNVGGDPVKFGLVASLNRPGGNVTGVNMFTSDLQAKRLGLLHEMTPKAAVIGSLINPNNSTTVDQSKQMQESARQLGLRLLVRDARNDSDIEPAFESLVRDGTDAFVVAADPFLSSQRDRLVKLAAKHRLPAMWEWFDSIEAGGLMSYGTSIEESYRQVGVYAGRVLKGEKPAEMPVMRPVQFDLGINLNTAKALGIEVPATLLARADRVIE